MTRFLKLFPSMDQSFFDFFSIGALFARRVYSSINKSDYYNSSLLFTNDRRKSRVDHETHAFASTMGAIQDEI
jgi:hypothetical protein